MSYATILYSVNNRIAEIRLNRPHRLNAVVTELYSEIIDALNKAEKDPNVSVIILTGEGRAFCVGADLKEHGKGERTDLEKLEYLNLGNDVCQRIYENDKVVIAFFIAWVALNQDIGYFPLVYGEDKEIAVQLFFAFMIGVSLVLQLLLIGHQNHQKSITAIMEAKVRQRTAELEEAKRQAEYLSRIDPLTQLNNRRAFFEFGKQVQLQSIRSAESFALIMLDIDHFKKINDSYGHDIGDIALKELAKTLTSNSRGTDIVGRLGGEEFAIILPNTDQNEAQNLAERIRLAISDIHIVEGEADFKFTSSFGIALSHHPSRKVADILKQADAALYQAKAEGRNRVVTYAEKGKSA